MPPKQTITEWVNVGLTKQQSLDLAKYIRTHNAHDVHTKGDAIREFINEGLYNDTVQRNIELTVLLNGLSNVKTKADGIAWNKEKDRLLGGE